MLLRISALLRAAMTCPGARSTKLVTSCAIAPIRPGVMEDLKAAEDVPDWATELTELLTPLLPLALDILRVTYGTCQKLAGGGGGIGGRGS